MGLPHVPVLMTPANPIPGGLYDAASVSDTTDARHIGGITLQSPNRGASDTWPTECPTPDGTPDKAGARPDWDEFPATAVWAADGCNAVGTTEEEAQNRAAHSLRLKEPIRVEEHVAEQLATITPATTAADIVAAVAHLDEVLAAEGYAGVIHARRGLLAVAEKADMVIRQGSRLTTPGGHQWAFGVGYTSLGDTLVGTGPVLVRRSPVIHAPATAHTANQVLAVAERVVTVAWDAPTAAVTITKEP